MKIGRYLLFLIMVLGLGIVAIGCDETDPLDEEDPIDEEPIDEEPIDEEPIEEEPVLTDLQKVEKWILDEYKDKIIGENQTFPITDLEFGSLISWRSFDPEYLTNAGVYTAPIVDYPTELLCSVKLNGETKQIFVPVIIKGYGTVMDAIEIYVDKVIGTEVYVNLPLPLSVPEYPCVITWSSSAPEVFSSTGNFSKPEADTAFTLTFQVVLGDETQTFERNMIAKGYTDLQKAHQIQLEYDAVYGLISEVSETLTLSTESETYASVITWESSNPGVIASDGTFRQPLYDQNVNLTVTIQVGEGILKSTYNVHVTGNVAEAKWSQIDAFLNSVCKPEINTIDLFYLYGSEAGYERVPSQNIGYLPFYDAAPMTIIQEIVPMTNMTIRPGINRTETKYIVIHNTGMAAPSATAKVLSSYIQNSTRVASWHFSLDDNETYQQLGIEEVGWHAASHEGNYFGIGIESCVYQGVDFNQVMRRLAKLTAKLLIDYHLGFDAIKQHYDFSQKNCPQVIREANRWGEFIDLVQIEYFAQTQLQDVTFVWKSLSPEIMDDTGKVISHPNQKTTVSFQVTVTYGGETRVFTYQSALLDL